MSILKKIQQLCKENGTNPSKLEIELGFGKGTLYKWEKSSPNTDKLSKVADFFGVSVDYLLEKTEFKSLPNIQKYDNFIIKNKIDIYKTMNFLLEQLDNYQNPLMFNGEIIDNNTREILRDNLNNSLKIAKMISNQKYSNKK